MEMKPGEDYRRRFGGALRFLSQEQDLLRSGILDRCYALAHLSPLAIGSKDGGVIGDSNSGSRDVSKF